MNALKIVVTGGPSGGKTTLIEALQKDMAGKLSVVPEAASILYRGGFPRRNTDNGKRHAQKAIYFTQKELETMIQAEALTPVVVCDRGSIDSVAYWPGSEEEFFSSISSTKAQELARYHWVIHLDTASESAFDSSNPIRTETPIEALELNQKIKLAWQGHPQRLIIAHQQEFLAKITKARDVIQKIINGARYQELVKEVHL